MNELTFVWYSTHIPSGSKTVAWSFVPRKDEVVELEVPIKGSKRELSSFLVQQVKARDDEANSGVKIKIVLMYIGPVTDDL